MKKKGKIYNADSYKNLKGESLCAELLENGIKYQNLSVFHESGFRRRFKDDIEKVAIDEDHYTDQFLFSIYINREGIYDKLPEGLFHQSKGSANNRTVEKMVLEHKQFKEEEKQARKFFSPFELEFFSYSVEVEQEERKLLRSMLSGDFTQTFYDFWEIDQEIPKELSSVMVQVMPWANMIKGNLKTTAKVLELILHRKIEVKETIVDTQNANGIGFMLNESCLCIDTILGNQYNESSVRWTFNILNLTAEDLKYYQENKVFKKFMNRFEEIFIPLEVEVSFQFEPSFASYETNYLGNGFRI
jgi:hypothetical protein